MSTTVTSKRFSLSLNDWWKGLILAIVAPVLKVFMDSIDMGELTFNWLALGKVALAAGMAYILKNFFDKPKIVITDAPKATIEAVKNDEAEVKVIPK